MTRFRHVANRRVTIYAGVNTRPQEIPEGKVRCPGCGSPVSLTKRGKIRAHKDRDKVPCPHRWYGKPIELTDIPTVVLPAERRAPEPRRVPKSRAADDPTRQVTGHCHDCDKRIPWGRMFCGQCGRKRDANRAKGGKR